MWTPFVPSLLFSPLQDCAFHTKFTYEFYHIGLKIGTDLIYLSPVFILHFVQVDGFFPFVHTSETAIRQDVCANMLIPLERQRNQLPTLFPFVGCYLFPAIGTLNYLPASHWAWNKMSIYLPPYIFAFLGAEDYLIDSPMELEWTSHQTRPASLQKRHGARSFCIQLTQQIFSGVNVQVKSTFVPVRYFSISSGPQLFDPMPASIASTHSTVLPQGSIS